MNPWTYRMGRMPVVDPDAHCTEPRCPMAAHPHPPSYRVDAVNAEGVTRTRLVCTSAAAAMAERIGHAFPPGLWKL